MGSGRLAVVVWTLWCGAFCFFFGVVRCLYVNVEEKRWEKIVVYLSVSLSHELLTDW